MDLTQIRGLKVSVTAPVECLVAKVRFSLTYRLSIRQMMPELSRWAFRTQELQIPSKNLWSMPGDTGVGRREPGAKIQGRANKTTG